MSINIKNLCKQIKVDARRSLIWTLENGVHYITNRHYAVKYTVLPREVLVSLFSAFASIPLEGRSLELTRFAEGPLDHEKPITIEKIFASCESNIEAELTSIITQYDKFSYRIIKKGELLIKVNQEYINLLDMHGDKPKCGGRFEPLSFCNNQLIILPVRVENASEDQTIHELLSAS